MFLHNVHLSKLLIGTGQAYTQRDMQADGRIISISPRMRLHLQSSESAVGGALGL